MANETLTRLWTWIFDLPGDLLIQMRLLLQEFIFATAGINIKKIYMNKIYDERRLDLLPAFLEDSLSLPNLYLAGTNTVYYFITMSSGGRQNMVGRKLMAWVIELLILKIYVMR